MTRVASQLTFCSPTQILRRMVVEQDEHNQIKRLFSMDENLVESANTLFFDGIMSAEIISVKEIMSATEIAQLAINYNYIDASNQLPTNIKPNGKPLLLDFGTSSLAEINRQLVHLAPALCTFSIFDIIAACTYYPALLLNQQAALTEKRIAKLLLWEGVDLVNKNITELTQIREIT